MSFCQLDCEKAIKASRETYELEKLEHAKKDEELMLQIAAIQEFEKKAVTAAEDEELMLALSLSLYQLEQDEEKEDVYFGQPVQPYPTTQGRTKESVQDRTNRLKEEEETFSKHARLNARNGNTFPQKYTQAFLSMLSVPCQANLFDLSGRTLSNSSNAGDLDPRFFDAIPKRFLNTFKNLSPEEQQNLCPFNCFASLLHCHQKQMTDGDAKFWLELIKKRGSKTEFLDVDLPQEVTDAVIRYGIESVVYTMTDQIIVTLTVPQKITQTIGDRKFVLVHKYKHWALYEAI